MSSPEDVLQAAAKDGTLDPKDWPSALETILSRLDHNFHNEFPRPSIIPSNPPRPQNPTAIPAKQEQASSQESQTADKENAPPSTPPSRPPVPTFQAGADVTPASSTTLSGDSSPEAYPPELVSQLDYIRTTLTKNFSRSPPHTIQRLAELTVTPRAHYRFLPAYLRALDRVVSVSSPTTTFPLPQATVPTNHSLVNGATPASSAHVNSTFGSDESLGGALLTPIPWLRPDRSQEDGSTRGGSNGGSQSELISESTEMVDGPNGAGRIETVTVSNGVLTSSPAPNPTVPSNVPTNTASSAPNTESLRDTGAITQGELLRQEQEAGVVPVSQTHTLHPSPHAHSHPQPHSILPSNAPSHAAAPSDSDPDPSSVPGEDEDVSASADTEAGAAEGRDERPHARGPERIGMEDMGPQQERSGTHLDIAAAVGRQPSSPGRSSTSPGIKEEEDAESKKEVEMTDADAMGGEEEGKKEGSVKVEDEDVVLTDVDGNADKKLDEGK